MAGALPRVLQGAAVAPVGPAGLEARPKVANASFDAMVGVQALPHMQLAAAWQRQQVPLPLPTSTPTPGLGACLDE